MTPPLKLGIPKGSLQDSTTRLFGRAGWRINVNGRSYFPEIDDEGIECSICRAQEMSRYVESGTLDAGITGMDWIKENDSEVVYVEELIYSKVSTRPARWVLAVAKDSPIKRPEDLGGMRVATEMVNFTKRYFEEAGIDVTVHFSWGATEAKVVNGLADAIVEVTETGSTIRAHGLRIIAELMQSTTQLIANKAAWEVPEKRKKIQQIAMLLKAALVAEKLVALKMNVPKIKVQDVVEALPSLNAPTVSPLYNSDWFSVETVVDESVVRDLIPEIMEKGAEGIIEYSLNKVI
ncbi:MAG: ATP phosphoribosyltransferase [Desulfarculus sp.]|nr:ATP phosphoribosyltransferase [Pseudomonadota bacterium]MBV1716832.1 ATP phosphoribosyltransferase [Desulfarculus sp.]MBU4574772.1 ATP phosphoribosyltransferase [Pseudomonadota bacterium]MBU4598889.1 ATP phosphoribosyltransferase [Pseudomonadota bacterium]MBV1738335.1 ATP phosphoribosyltransferase [Desulfarculus sp.]